MLIEVLIYLLKILGVLLLVAYVLRAIYLSYYLKDVSSPPSYPFLGHITIMKAPKQILDQLTDLQREHGGFIRFCFLFILNIFLITDVKIIEMILNGTKFLEKGREYLFLSRWLGTGLLTAGAEKWKITRKIITPTFHFQILEQFIEIYHSASNILIGKLKKEVGKDTDIYPYVTLCALDVICESAMGVQINAQEKSDSEYVKSVQLISKIIRKRIFFPIINIFYIFSVAHMKERKALKVLHGHTNAVIKERRQALKDSKNIKIETTKKRRLAFLDLLLESTINERPMTDEEIREEVDTFMFEGHDTTSSATAFTLYCLGLNQKVQDKVVEELKTIFGDDKNRMPSYEELNEMKYLEMVIKEALRLYPPVPFISRQATSDTAYFGGLIPRRATLGISIYILHRDPTIYPDPEKFDPDRFTLENQQTRSPFSYIPFSAGPRNCIGQRFAMMELKSTIAKVLRNFEIHPVKGFEPILVPDAILKSLNGVNVRLEHRDF
ncbi:cytochrome P450 4c3-like [Onthophagus taurus]|uniref:cytochrome P450 4c3-like n=1 Tax=Onthophagus taurus TaxID=166361 RepID=UPI001F12830F|nr:cytochrome P450 4c3-like [Onthophagus taurus]